MPRTRNGLTVKQERFCRAYVKTGNGAKAARMAGYSDDSDRIIASENLTKPNIKARIDELEANASVAAGLTDEQIKAGLLKIALDDKEQGGTRNRSWELLGKARGMFKDVVRSESEEMTDAQLLELIGGLFGPDLQLEAARRLGLDVVTPEGEDMPEERQ